MQTLLVSTLALLAGCAFQPLGDSYKNGQQLNPTGQIQTAEDLRIWLDRITPDARVEVFVKGHGWVTLSTGDLRAVVEQKPTSVVMGPKRNWP
jgi:hypothetical protein